MAPFTTTAMSDTSIENGGVRRRSLSGASALLARRFTRQSSAPRPTASRSEYTTRRRATIISSSSDNLSQQELDNIKVHVRIVPNIVNPSRSLIFDIVDRELDVGSVIRIGRYSERHANLNCMSFKSKVVSRCHCEVFVETDGKLYIRDTKSSSGTFLNNVRLSSAGNESRPIELNNGDIVQLGVDFQGGREEMYRSVKMRFELNRSSRTRPLSFNLNAFQNLRNLTLQQQNNNSAIVEEESVFIATSPTASTPPEKEEGPKNNHTHHQLKSTNNILPCTTTTIDNEIDECCICLYALAPFQALFVSPCSHTYHFKCIRPLLLSYPGFQCPICRTYSDLEANVAIEVMEKYDINYNNRATVIISDTTTDNSHPAYSGLCLQSNQFSDDNTSDDENQPLSTIEMSLDNNNNNTSSATSFPSSSALTNEAHNRTPFHVTDSFVYSPVIYSDVVPNSLLPLGDNQQNDHRHPTDILNHNEQDDRIMSNTDDEQDFNNTATITNTSRPARTSHIMEKLKMVFLGGENNKTRHSHNNKIHQRPLSYTLDNSISIVRTNNNTRHQGSSSGGNSSTVLPLSQTLSRQSTTHLTEINSNSRRERSIQQAMYVDGY